MTKKIYSILFLLALLPLSTRAQQQVNFGPLHSADSPREDWILPGDTVIDAGQPKIYTGKPMKNPTVPSLARPSAAVPSLAATSLTAMQDSTYYNNPISNLTNSWASPLDYGYGWGLHKGLNLSVDLSAFATFGKHVPYRSGFTQTINATYLAPITKDNKLWMALGAYVNNVNYGSDSYHDGGVYGILGYKFDEHWEAYVYGQVSVANNYNSIYNRYAGYSPYGGYGRWGYGMYPGLWGMGVMPGGYGMGAAGANVLGAGVKYTSKNFSIGINVEGNWYNQNQPAYFKQYDYPVPEPNKK